MAQLEEGYFLDFNTTIDSIDKEFRPYIDNYHEKFDEWINKEAQTFDDFLYLMKTYYYFMTYTVDKNYLSNAHRATKTLYSKATNDLLAIHNCLKSGSLHQAYTILRSLLETTALTKFIYQKPDQRLDLYYNYRFFELQPKFKDMNHPNFNKINEEYLKHKHNYTPYREWYDKELRHEINSKLEFKKLRTKNKMTFKKICIVVGMENDYNLMYSSLSHSTHSTSLLDHLFVSNSGNYSVAPIFKKDKALTTACVTIGFLDSIYKDILAHSNPTASTSLNAYSNWMLFCLQSLHDEIKPIFPPI